MADEEDDDDDSWGEVLSTIGHVLVDIFGKK